MTRRMRVPMGIAATGALALASCGSGGDDDDAATDSTGPAAATGSTAPAAPAVPTTVTSADDVDTTATDVDAGGDCPFDTDQVSAAVAHEVVQRDGCEWEAVDLEGAILEVYFSGSDAMHLDNSAGDAVDGVGDAARLDVSGALVFQVGDNHYVVQVISMGGATDVDPEVAQVELAKIAVTSLS
jgi:hypothetical protein